MSKHRHHQTGYQATKVSRKNGRLQGAALIIVLAFLVIITGLVVAFLSSITNETTGSKATADASTTRTLADSTIQLAIAQIRDATAGFDRNSNGVLVTASPITWASQPGAIRTYDTRGSNAAVYKLYSSTNMVDRSGIYNPTNDLPTNANWSTASGGEWVDLNEPVIAQGVTNYPIMDPALAMTAANTTNYVDGFQIATNNTTLSNAPNRAAMPVRWLYVLRDGSITIPSPVASGIVNFSASAIKPSSNNPIVARIAFWTDDETCKLNLNTASEGSFWGAPYYSTTFDVAMAQYPPSAREYNRFPGHPASTCLSPVLWSELGLTNPSQYLSAFPGVPIYSGGTTDYDREYNAAFGVATNFISTSTTTYLSNVLSRVAPRYAWGGSLAGSKTLLAGYTGSITNTSIGLTNLSGMRLYSSIDEFFFAPTNTSVTNRVSNSLAFSPQDVSSLRFFLTTTSRAPEINPQNLPKICMWPVPDANRMTANASYSIAGTNNTRTLFDQTIAFCSTLGTNAYFTTRYDATTSTNDFTSRNRTLYSYLRSCFNQPVPGYSGGAFASSGASKWSSFRADQITTLFFDYIRSCINLADSSAARYDTNGLITNSVSEAFKFNYTTPYLTNGRIQSGTGQVAPLVATNGTKGIGRIPILRGGALLFMARAADQPPLMLDDEVSRRPILYTKDGTLVPYASPSMVSNMMAGNLYALINPMHPWTCPQMWNGKTETNTFTFTNVTISSSVSAGVTNWTTNRTISTFIYGGTNNYASNTANINGRMFQYTNVMVPQLMRSGMPVLADSAPSNLFKDLSNFDSNNAGALFPIFDLSASKADMPAISGSQVSGKAAPWTKCFPCFEDEPSITAGQKEGTDKGYFWITADINNAKFAYPSATATNTNNRIPYLSALNMTTIRQVNTYFTGASSRTNATLPIVPNMTNLITHTGLPYLSVPNAQSGRFDLTNENYIDKNEPVKLKLYQTRMEALYLPELVNVAPGQIGIDPRIGLRVNQGNLTALMVNGKNIPFLSTGNISDFARSGGFRASTSTISGDPENRYLYSLGLQYLLDNNIGTNIPTNTAIQCYTTNGSANVLLAINQTFQFSGGNIEHTIFYATNSSTPAQVATLNFPSASFATPMLPCTPYRDMDSANATNKVYRCKYFPPDRAVYIQYLANASPPVPTASRSTPWDRLTANPGRGAFQEHFNFPSYMNCSDVTPSASGGVAFWTDSGAEYDASYVWYTNGMNRITADTIQAVEIRFGDPRIISCLSNVPSSAYAPNLNYGDTNQYTILGWPVYLRNAHSMRSGRMPLNGGMYGSFLGVTTNSEVGWRSSYLYPPMVQKANVTNNLSLSIPSGSRKMGTISFDQTTPFYKTNNFCGHTLARMWNSFNTTDGHSSYPYAGSDCVFNSTNDAFFSVWSKGGDYDNGYAMMPDGPTINKADEGFGAANNYAWGDTPYFTIFAPRAAGINTFSPNRMVVSPVMFGSLPSLDNNWSTANPAVTITNSAWQTLQFSPNPNALNTNLFAIRAASNGYSDAGMRPTNTILPDHLLLDYFWMPVVEPYPISEPFSTAGKVNMNYAIAPFSYIRRDAAVRGVLKPVMISAVDDRWSYDYKLRHLVTFDDTSACVFNDPNRQPNPLSSMTNTNSYNPISYNRYGSNTGQFYFHYPIHINETLKQFDYRFTNAGNGSGDLFRYPSEICTLWLYPARQPTTNNPTAATNVMTNSLGTNILWNSNSTAIESWWYDNPGTDRKGLTGDNVRERPYNYLYPRLTTKSNTYQLHYRVQLLKQSPSAMPSGATTRAQGGAWDIFIDPSNTSQTVKDQVVGELRGSASIERYIDPSDTTLPDFAGMINSNTNNFTNPACIMDTYYKFRVFNFKVFTP